MTNRFFQSPQGYGVPSFRSPTGDVVLVVVDVVPIWIETPHNGLVASLDCNPKNQYFFKFSLKVTLELEIPQVESSELVELPCELKLKTW